MIRYWIVLAVVLASCLVISPYAEGESPTTLKMIVWEPPPPITDSDVIQLVAATPEVVFAGGAYIEQSSSLFVNGLDIDWTISTWQSGAGGSIPEARPMMCIAEVGPLPAGSYQVTADWTHVGGGGLLVGAPSSGTGSLTFDVVPEPSTLMILGAACLLMCFVRVR